MAVTPASNQDLRDLPVSVVSSVLVVSSVPSVSSFPALPFLDAPDRLIDLALDLGSSGLKFHHI